MSFLGFLNFFKKSAPEASNEGADRMNPNNGEKRSNSIVGGDSPIGLLARIALNSAENITHKVFPNEEIREGNLEKTSTLALAGMTLKEIPLDTPQVTSRGLSRVS